MLMFTTIFSYQRHMSRWQGAHALPPLWQNFKKAGFLVYFRIFDIYLELPLFNTTKPYER